MHTFVVMLHLWLCAQVPVSLRELLAHLGTGPSGPSDENLTNYIEVKRTNGSDGSDESDRRQERAVLEIKQVVEPRASSLSHNFSEGSIGSQWTVSSRKRRRQESHDQDFWYFLTHWLHLLAAKTQTNLFKSIGEKTLGMFSRWGRLLSKVKVSGLKCKTHTHKMNCLYSRVAVICCFRCMRKDLNKAY